MMKPFRTRGIWWLPDSPSEKVSGTLSYSPVSGLHLNVIGRLMPGTEWGLPVVHGLTRTGPATLTEVYFDGVAESFHEVEGITYAEQRWQPTQAFVGAILGDPEAALFRAAEVQFEHLAEWMDIGYLGAHFTPGEDYSIARQLERSDLPAPSGEYKTDFENASISLRWDLSYRSGHHTVSISQEAFYVLEFSTPITWEAARSRYLWPLQQLLAFSILEPTAPTRVILYPVTTEASRGTESGPQMLQVYYSAGQAHVKRRRISRLDMLLNLRHLGFDPAQLLLNWMRVYSKHSDPINIRLKDMRDAYIDDQVLTRVQAVEAYHRVHSGEDTIVSSEEHEKIQAMLLGFLNIGVPRYYKKRVEQLLRFANEPFLARRLGQILKRLKGVIPVLDSPPKRGVEQLIKNVTGTRNYLTHYDPKSRSKSLPEAEFFHLVHAMELIFDCCILQDLGFSDQRIRQLIERNRRLQYSIEDIRYLMLRKTPGS